MEIENNSINKRISKYRKMAGLTQAEVAESLGMKRNTYAHMEKYGNPSPDILKKLAKVLKVSIAMLLFDDKDIIAPPKDNIIRFAESKPGDNLMPLSLAEENFIKIFRVLTKEQQSQVSDFIIKQYTKKGDK